MTQTVLPEAETAPMLFWALLASGQITMRNVNALDALRVLTDRNPLDPAGGYHNLQSAEAA